jgi:RHS repeat-associated protein
VEEHEGKFTGKDFDAEISLYYFNARWYDPELGRFISVDPIKDGVNWYVYCSNNPLICIDPSGLEDDEKITPVKPPRDIYPVDNDYPEHAPIESPEDYDEYLQDVSERYAGDIEKAYAENPELFMETFAALPLRYQHFALMLTRYNSGVGKKNPFTKGVSDAAKTYLKITATEGSPENYTMLEKDYGIISAEIVKQLSIEYRTGSEYFRFVGNEHDAQMQMRIGCLQTGIAIEYFSKNSTSPTVQEPDTPWRNQTTVSGGGVHKNANAYVGNQGVYEIKIDGKLYKYGKADMTKISSTGNPVRLQSQINKLQRLNPNAQITGKVLYQNQSISTLDIKKVETAYVQQYYDYYHSFPSGNLNHPGIVKR